MELKLPGWANVSLIFGNISRLTRYITFGLHCDSVTSIDVSHADLAWFDPFCYDRHLVVSEPCWVDSLTTPAHTWPARRNTTRQQQVWSVPGVRPLTRCSRWTDDRTSADVRELMTQSDGETRQNKRQLASVALESTRPVARRARVGWYIQYGHCHV